ncbi:hypothetical protein [Alkalicoccobacillus gibsonii]|uniref:hypothetical protein n=1 Tax=Alkalicoccobacillus gibsonii TaxID=79881 RepID=UPI001AEEBED9|nr:hypothetical protein [Alkalicoccobacillus gibsonii]
MPIESIAITKLEGGQEFKNYPELCRYMGWSQSRSPTTKEGRLKELRRYYELDESAPRVIKVVAVRDDPLPKVDNRGKFKGDYRDSIFTPNIQASLIYMATSSKEPVVRTYNQLLQDLGIVNLNYSQCKLNPRGLEKVTDIPREVIDDFLQSVKSFKKTIKRVLDNLSDSKILRYETKIKVISDSKHSVATEEQEEQVIQYREKVLEIFDCKNFQEVLRKGKGMEYDKKLKDYFKQYTDFTSAYEALMITGKRYKFQRSQDYLFNEFRKSAIQKESKVKLEHNAIVRQSKTKADWGKEYDNEYRTKENYIEQINTLIDLLIDPQADDIRKPTKDAQEQETKLDDELLELLDTGMDELFG